jgi:two-component system OmpR family sensor kinase
MSLRARLLVVLAALATVGVLIADVVTYAALRSFLTDRVDSTLAGSARVLQSPIGRAGFGNPGAFAQLASLTPGIFIQIRSQDGEVVWSGVLARPDESPPLPRLPSALSPPEHGAASSFTVGSRRGGTDFRVRAEPLPFGGTLVVAAPLSDVEATLDRLLLIEGLVSLAVVAAIVGLGLWLVRLGLRPLRRIEETAGAIAAGDLSRRVERADERTEVGRLGAALNTMLAQIERAFAERAASEQRLRRFIADASHELRTPLASVQAYAELFERGARDRPADLERAMAGIEREAIRMGVLVDDLLLLARLDQGRPLERQEVDLAEVASEAVDAARALEPDRAIELVAPEPAVLVGDPTRLRQVVDNLLANVRAHTPRSAAATVRVLRENHHALLEVSDDGPNLTNEQAAHAFERFYRGDPSRSRDSGGAGLGLSIVASIAEAHGGTATVVRDAAPGATFRVVLPLPDDLEAIRRVGETPEAEEVVGATHASPEKRATAPEKRATTRAIWHGRGR